MLKIEHTVVFGWEAAIRGMRNPMNSWEKSDSGPAVDCGKCGKIEREGVCRKEDRDCTGHECFCVGENDLALMQRLARSGPDHGKFLRMVNVTADITAPLYWWKEYDTYKVGTVANSCSTMHKIADKKFEESDFSAEHLFDAESEEVEFPIICGKEHTPIWLLHATIKILNYYREKYIKAKENCADAFALKQYWWQMIQMLPSSYNQRRTVQLNYEVLRKMYFARKEHKLDEWHALCAWMLALPYFPEICVGEGGKD